MTNETKQTAVEWLEFEITRRGPKENNPPQWLIELYKQAKEMEKEQIIVAWIATDNELQRIAAEQYYNETFGGKQQATTSFSFAESNGTSTTFMCYEFISDGLNNTITKCMNCGKERYQHPNITNL